MGLSARLLTTIAFAGKANSDNLLTSREFFESFLKARRASASSDFISKASDVLWRKEFLEVDEEKIQKVRQEIETLRKIKDEAYAEGFLKLSQAKRWDLGLESAPINQSTQSIERERAREDRRKIGFLEYEALKRELSLMTIGVGLACTAYCSVVLSIEDAVSYGIGACTSWVYLQLLAKHVEGISRANIPEVFGKKRRRRIGIRSDDVENSLKKTIQGLGFALSSPRLILPAGLFLLWAFVAQLNEDSSLIFKLKLAPLYFGFFAYKAAALIQAYRDNKDLLFLFEKNEAE